MTIKITKNQTPDVRKVSFVTDDVEKVTMSIDAAMLNQVTKHLTDMYRKPLESMIRETISNALDASADGVVEVTPPSTLFEYVKVRDWGVGMSREEVVSVYTQYGSSTKRDDLTTIGAKGAGAKSPLSYAHSFNVVTVKDGVKTEVVMTRGEESNVAELSPSVATDEPNGTTVTIPVMSKDVIEARKLITEEYPAYDIHERIRVVGVEDAPKFAHNFAKLDTVTLTDGDKSVGVDVYVRRECRVWNLANAIGHIDRGSDDVNFVIGGYGYTKSGSKQKPSIVVDLLPGLVDFVPSRESIIDNSRLSGLLSEIHSSLCGKGLADDFRLANWMLDEMIDDLTFAQQLGVYSVLREAEKN